MTLPVQSRRTLWSSALSGEYETMLKAAASPETQALIQLEREAYQAWLGAYESCLAARFPDDADAVDGRMADQLMRHSAMLCWLNHPEEPAPASFAALPNDSAVAPPERCVLEARVENGELIRSVELCDAHRTIARAAALVPADQARTLWSMSLANLNESLEADPGALRTEQEAFETWLGVYEALIGQLRPDQPDTAAGLASEALMEYVVERCALSAR